MSALLLAMVAAVSHRAVPVEDGIRWDSEVQMMPRAEGAVVLTLAQPLPSTHRLRWATADESRTVLTIPIAKAGRTTWQTLQTEGDPHPPLVAGDVVQRVEGPLRPDRGLKLMHRGRSRRLAVGVEKVDVERLDRALGPGRGPRWYLRARDVPDGRFGTIVDRRGFKAFAVGLLALLGVVGLGVYRWLGRRARWEATQALWRSESLEL